MPNPHFNNMHGANRTQGEGASNTSKGSKPAAGTPMKTANWPGVPGKTQSGNRSAGTEKCGCMGEFYVKQIGL